MKKMSNDSIAWGSNVLYSMVGHLDEDTLQILIDELDDAVARICEEYEVA
jgi:hypothetical protein